MFKRWRSLARAKVGDFVPRIIFPFPWCAEWSPDGWPCTRNKWHLGQHVSEDFLQNVMAVWKDT